MVDKIAAKLRKSITEREVPSHSMEKIVEATGSVIANMEARTGPISALSRQIDDDAANQHAQPCDDSAVPAHQQLTGQKDIKCHS